MRSGNSTIVSKNVDKGLVGLYGLLVLFGLATIFSSAYSEDYPSIFSLNMEYGKQIMYIGVAIVAGFVILLTEGRLINYYAYHLYGLVMLSLIAVLFTRDINGAHSWFKLGGFSLQPSEFAKFATALAFAKLLSSPNIKLKDGRTKLYSIAILAIPSLLITLQPDPGTVLVFLSFVFVMYREGLSGHFLLIGVGGALLAVLTIFFRDYGDPPEKAFSFFGMGVSGNIVLAILISFLCGIAAVIIWRFVRPRFRKRYLIRTLIAWIAAVIVCFGTLWTYENVLKQRHRDRIDVILGLKIDKKDIGYNQAQSMAAVGSGGFFGKGYGDATLSNDQFNQVPEQSTDFIFCSWGEERGFLGSLVLIVLYTAFMIKIIMIAERQKSSFTRIYGYCVACIFFFHFLINIGMVTGIAPVVGIPLPFFSYGGSSIIGFTVLVFILLRLDAERKDVLG